MENIYTQAIADAKAVRESAMANAKAAIQEAFEPKIKAMLKKHIVENEGLEEEYDEMDEMQSHEEEMDEMEMTDEAPMDSPNELDETSLDEILAELDELDEADEIEEAETELEEAYEMDEAEEDEEETETEEETEEDGEKEESEEETKVVDITLGDLVDAIKAAMGSEAPAPEMGGEETAAEDDISLDEILAELEDEIEEGEGSGDYMDEAKKKAKDKEEKEKKAEKELKEAKKAIAAMRAELNEINLLNAKLLYVNKIFKSKSLTEAQKVKVLNAFDKATTIKEAKNTYSILNDSITTAPKKSLKESYGFASKPTGATSKTNTVDSDPFISRMQKLAGL
jgi:hypothetical protein